MTWRTASHPSTDHCCACASSTPSLPPPFDFDPSWTLLLAKPRASVSPPLASPAIQGRDVGLTVTTRRGRVLPVPNGCSLHFPPRQLWMLLGPNGCGKSTPSQEH
nr:unnamed protein product [Digitaria exilis]